MTSKLWLRLSMVLAFCVGFVALTGASLARVAYDYQRPVSVAQVGDSNHATCGFDAGEMPTATKNCRKLPAPNGFLFVLPKFLAAEGARFSRVGGAAGDFLVPGEGTLQAGLQDPAMYGTRLTATPTFNAGLDPALYGRTLGSGLNASVEIGPTAFSSRGNLIQTIIHEETHIRLDLRAAQGSQRAIGIQGSLSSEEAYVESVAQRYWRMYGGR